MDIIDSLNLDLKKLSGTVDWSGYPDAQRGVMQTQFEMQYTQIYLNKKQIALMGWMKWATVVIAASSVIQLILFAVR